jgi:hypothetical protein
MFVLRRFITTTATGKFKPTEAPDEYKVRIYVGGGQSEKKATEKAVQEISKFMPAQGYLYYTIVKQRYNWLPTSYYEFTVQFRRA